MLLISSLVVRFRILWGFLPFPLGCILREAFGFSVVEGTGIRLSGVTRSGVIRLFIMLSEINVLIGCSSKDFFIENSLLNNLNSGMLKKYRELDKRQIIKTKRSDR